MGWCQDAAEKTPPKRYALCSSMRFNIKTTYGHEYPQATRRHIEIPPFYGNETEQDADKWIDMYEAWASQECLNSRKKLQLVLLGLFSEAYVWARDLDMEKAKWREFVRLFRERYVGDPTPWAGSAKFPYWLYFSGAARPVPGQSQGPSGVGIVLVSPLKELEVATVSQYLGRHCSVHVAEYTALVMGMETALRRGVRHLTIMCDSLLVFNQVTGKWQACHSSVREFKVRAHELLNEFRTCCAVFIPQKCNAEAQGLANKAIDGSTDHTGIARHKVQGAQTAYVNNPCPYYKTTLCRDWEGGYCRYGMHCQRAHGYQELRM